MQLRRGMFVARLDRPWEGTRFPIQGFLIKSDDDIETVCHYCKHVFIDVYKSSSSNAEFPAVNATSQADNTKKKENLSARSTRQLLTRLAIEKYRTTNSFKREVKKAWPILRNLEREIKQLIQPGGYLNKAVYEKIHNSTSDLVESVIRNPDAMVWLCRVQRNNITVYQHVLRLAILGCLVGRQMGLNRFLLVDLTMALLMTGIGKSLLTGNILKRYRFDQVLPSYQRHLNLTLECLENSSMPGVNLIDIIANYCERIDGSGYPMAKQGKSIPLLARIAGLIEYFEIQVNPFERQYAKSPSDAISQLNEVKGKLFDEALVEKFIAAVGIYPTGTLVELNDERIAIVCAQTYEKRLRASIVTLTNRRGDVLEDLHILDLNMPNQWQLNNARLRIRRGLPINSLPDAVIESVHDWLFNKNIGTWGKLKNRLTS